MWAKKSAIHIVCPTLGVGVLKYLNTMCQVLLLSMPVCGGGTCVGEISCGYSTGATCVILLSYIRNC